MKTHNSLLNPIGMTPKDIKDALYEKGLNQAAIARAINVTPGCVNRAVHDRDVQTRVMKAIAEAIGRDVKEVWPQHFLNRTPKRGRKIVSWNRKAAA